MIRRRARAIRGRAVATRVLALFALTALGCVAGPRNAAADGEFPTELKTIEKLRFEGRHHVSRKDLVSVLKTRAPSIWPWSKSQFLRLDFVRADTAAIEQVYHQQGYLDVRAHARLDKGRHSDGQVVTFVIEEGRRSRIARVDFQGLDAVPESQIRRKLYARAGRPFNPLYVLADTVRIADLYREKGYLPDVGALATRQGDSVFVHYAVVQGPLYRFGQANLSSPEQIRVKQRLILRELVYKPGEPYKASLVRESIEQIYRTGLFSQVQMTPLPDSTNRVVEFDLRVRERRPRWLDAGVGSGTSERLRFTGEWGHRNFNARGLQTVLSSKTAFDGQAKFLLARVEATLYDPWVLGARRRGLTSIYYENRHDRANPDYIVRQEGRGVSFQIRREYRSLTRLLVTQDNAFVRQHIDFTGAIPDSVRDSLILNVPPRYSTHRLQLAIDRDSRDDPINPFRGSVENFSAEIAGGPFRGTSSFTRIQAVTSWYRTVRRNSVLALHARAGAIDPFGNATAFLPGDVDSRVARVPIEDRFRIGGVNTLRGYNENALPALGGLALIQANVEVRMPLKGPLGLEVFGDAGNVWARPSYVRAGDFKVSFSNEPYDPGDLRVVGGVGLRLNTPVGPLRFDVSWSARPDPPQRDRKPRTQFAIGPAF